MTTPLMSLIPFNLPFELAADFQKSPTDYPTVRDLRLYSPIKPETPTELNKISAQKELAQPGSRAWEAFMTPPTKERPSAATTSPSLFRFSDLGSDLPLPNLPLPNLPLPNLPTAKTTIPPAQSNLTSLFKLDLPLNHNAASPHELIDTSKVPFEKYQSNPQTVITNQIDQLADQPLQYFGLSGRLSESIYPAELINRAPAPIKVEGSLEIDKKSSNYIPGWQQWLVLARQGDEIERTPEYNPYYHDIYGTSTLVQGYVCGELAPIEVPKLDIDLEWERLNDYPEPD